jgi:hypothetical protein
MGRQKNSSTVVKAKPQSYLCVSTVTFWLTDWHSDLLSNWMTKQMSWDLPKQKIMVWVVRLHTLHTMSHPTRLICVSIKNADSLHHVMPNKTNLNLCDGQERACCYWASRLITMTTKPLPIDQHKLKTTSLTEKSVRKLHP